MYTHVRHTVLTGRQRLVVQQGRSSKEAWKHRLYHISIYASAEWVEFQENHFYIFASLYNKGQLLRKEAIRNLQKLFPLVKKEERADLYYTRIISLGGLHIQIYISKMLGSTKH